jgi:hypothetical protein
MWKIHTKVDEVMGAQDCEMTSRFYLAWRYLVRARS